MHTFPPIEAVDWVEDRVQSGDFISVERYTQSSGSAKRTRQNDAIEVIGMIRRVAHHHRAVFMLNGVSDALKIAPSEVLRALGWWRREAPVTSDVPPRRPRTPTRRRHPVRSRGRPELVLVSAVQPRGGS